MDKPNKMPDIREGGTVLVLACPVIRCIDMSGNHWGFSPDGNVVLHLSLASARMDFTCFEYADGYVELGYPIQNDAGDLQWPKYVLLKGLEPHDDES